LPTNFFSSYYLPFPRSALYRASFLNREACDSHLQISSSNSKRNYAESFSDSFKILRANVVVNCSQDAV
jgi:hypothetical protein